MFAPPSPFVHTVCVAAAISSIAALRHFRLPATVFNDAAGHQMESADAADLAVATTSAMMVLDDVTKEGLALPLFTPPLACSFAVFTPRDNKSHGTRTVAVVDPTVVEELSADGGVTVAFTGHGEMTCLDFVGGEASEAKRAV